VEPVIRKMREQETGLVAALLLRANEENLAGFPQDVARAYRSELIDTGGRPPGQQTYVLDVAGGPVGSVAFLPDASHDTHPWPEDGSVLRFLAVEPAERGRGLGRRLVRVCIDSARARGSAFLALHTAPSMCAARKLYEGMGFERRPELDFDPSAHYGGGPRAGEPAWGLAYLLPLGPAAEARSG
jgi:GNAT superfamily N-acetyltransferase